MFCSPKRARCWLILAGASVYAGGAAVKGDVFNLPAGQTSVTLLTIGDPNNAPDPATGLGSVPYAYAMSQYDTTVAQYCAFLNSVASTDQYGLYNPSMQVPVLGEDPIGIVRSGTSGNFTYGVDAGSGNYPATSVSWGDAARFCNWLSNGQPDTGVENSTTTEDGSYALNGGADKSGP